MKKTFAVISAVSLMLLALITFCKSALEAYYHVLLLSNAGSFSTSDYLIDSNPCFIILIAVAFVCGAVALIEHIKTKE